jgi:hypothetical protein
MNTSTPNAQAVLTITGVRFTDSMVYTKLSDQREIGLPLDHLDLRWLANATPEQRDRWKVVARGRQLLWEELDDTRRPFSYATADCFHTAERQVARDRVAWRYGSPGRTIRRGGSRMRVGGPACAARPITRKTNESNGEAFVQPRRLSDTTL